ncbi:MAG: DUF4004 family protein [Clostridium sp.]|uniref:DUF4004 family protein n=1 Tax=Clostridium sp. TaxID=1506 RepID=UPI003F3B50F7
MHEELISKKDLLIDTEISYGQLYRWKRKNIIPEEWFIKKSVSTGQETFFPKEKILDRIKQIIELKDELSLDELAERFSNPNIENISLLRSYILENGVVSLNVLEKFDEIMGECKVYNSSKLFELFLYDELINTALLNINEVNNIVRGSSDAYNNLQGEEVLLIKRKLGVCFYYVVFNDKEIFTDNDAKIIYEVKICDIINKIKKFGV